MEKSFKNKFSALSEFVVRAETQLSKKLDNGSGYNKSAFRQLIQWFKGFK